MLQTFHKTVLYNQQTRRSEGVCPHQAKISVYFVIFLDVGGDAESGGGGWAFG